MPPNAKNWVGACNGRAEELDNKIDEDRLLVAVLDTTLLLDTAIDDDDAELLTGDEEGDEEGDIADDDGIRLDDDSVLTEDDMGIRGEEELDNDGVADDDEECNALDGNDANGMYTSNQCDCSIGDMAARTSKPVTMIKYTVE